MFGACSTCWRSRFLLVERGDKRFPPPPERPERKKSLSGVSRMSTLVSCELSRAKQIVARDARLRWDLIGANCECTTLYLGVVSTFSYSGRSVARQQLLATSLRLDNKAPLGAGYFCAPDLLLAKSGFGGLNNTNTYHARFPLTSSPA